MQLAVVAAEGHQNMSEAISDLKTQMDRQAQTDADSLAAVSTMVQSLNRSLETGLETVARTTYQAVVTNLADEISRNVSAPLHARIDALIDTMDFAEQSVKLLHLAADNTSSISQLFVDQLSSSLNASINTLNASYNNIDTKQQSLADHMSIMDDNLSQHSQQIGLLNASIENMTATLATAICEYQLTFSLIPAIRQFLTQPFLCSFFPCCLRLFVCFCLFMYSAPQVDRISSLASQVATLTGAVKLFESFDSISSLYTWLKDRFATVATVDDLARRIDDTNESLHVEISTVAQSLQQSLDEKIAGVDSSLEQHSRRIDALNATMGRSVDVAVEALSDQLQGYKADASRQIDLLTTTLSRSLEQSLAEKMAIVGTGLSQHSRQIDALNVTWSRSLQTVSDQMQSNKVDAEAALISAEQRWSANISSVTARTEALGRSLEQSLASKMEIFDEQQSRQIDVLNDQMLVNKMDTIRHLDLLNVTLGRSLDVAVVALSDRMRVSKVDAEAALTSAEQRWSANMSSVTARAEALGRSLEQSLANKMAIVGTSFEQQSRQIDALNGTFGHSLLAVSDQMLSNKLDASRQLDLLNVTLGRSLDAAATALSDRMLSNKVDAEAALISAEQRWTANISSVAARTEALGRSLEQSLASKMEIFDEQQSRQIDALNGTFGHSLLAVSDQMRSNKMDASRQFDLLNVSLGRSLDVAVVALSDQMRVNKMDAEAALVSAEQRWSTNMTSIAARAAAAAETDKIRATLFAKQLEDVTSQLTHFAPATSVAKIRSSLETVHHAMDDMVLRVQGDVGTFNASLHRLSIAADLDRARLTQYLAGMTAVESRLDNLDGRIGRSVFNLTSAIEALARQMHTDSTMTTEGIAKSLVTLETALNDDRSAAIQSWKSMDDRTNALSKGLEVAAAVSKGHWVDMSDRVDNLVNTIAASNQTVSTGLGDINARFAILAAQTQAQDAAHTHSTSMQSMRLDNLTDRVSHGHDLLSRVRGEISALSAAANDTNSVLMLQISAGQNLSARVSILESTLPLHLDTDKAHGVPAELKDLRATVDRVMLDVQAISVTRGDTTFFGGIQSAFAALVQTAIVLTAVLYFVISSLCVNRTNTTRSVPAGDASPEVGVEGTTTALQQDPQAVENSGLNDENVDVAVVVSTAEEALKAQFEVLEASHRKLAKSLKTAVTTSRSKMTELSQRLDRAVDVANSTRQQDNSARQQEIVEVKTASLAEVTTSYIHLPSFIPTLIYISSFIPSHIYLLPPFFLYLSPLCRSTAGWRECGRPSGRFGPPNWPRLLLLCDNHPQLLRVK